MSESAKRHEENSNLIKEIRALTDAAIRNQGASIKTLEIQIGQMSKVLQERGFGSLPSSTEANPRDQVKLISTTIEADSCPICRIRSLQYAVSTGQNRTLMYETRQIKILFPSHLNGYYCEENKGSYGPQFSEASFKASQSIPQKEKDPGSFTLPCFINNIFFDNALVDLGASVSVMPLSTYLNLGLGELAYTKLTVELADRTVKYPKGIAEKVLVSIVVDKYLGIKLDDALLRILKRHTADLIEKYSVLPDLESIKNQESKKISKEIIRIKREQGEKKQESTYTIRSTDKQRKLIFQI
ncbi:mitochondrial proton/calcium exchanger protein-like protein isoform X1 [Tanacetum coccineum]